MNQDNKLFLVSAEIMSASLEQSSKFNNKHITFRNPPFTPFDLRFLHHYETRSRVLASGSFLPTDKRSLICNTKPSDGQDRWKTHHCEIVTRFPREAGTRHPGVMQGGPVQSCLVEEVEGRTSVRRGYSKRNSEPAAAHVSRAR